jgi:predicted kinase
VTDLEIPDPSVVLLVGAAGAGKSTFAARQFPVDAVLSSDAMRAAVSGDLTDQSATRPAFAVLHRALDRRLAAGRLAVVDATNITARARRAILRVAARHRMPAVAIVLDLAGEVVLARNAARRERPVPEGAVTRHLVQLARALADAELDREGYVTVVYLRDADAVDRLSVRLVRSVPQAPSTAQQATQVPGRRPPGAGGQGSRSRAYVSGRRPRR